MTRRHVLLTASVGLLAVVPLSACAASNSASGPTRTAPTTVPGATLTPPIVTSQVPQSSSPGTSSTPPTSRPPTSSSAPATAPTTSSSPVPARSSCTKLTIRVLLGSGAPGYEFAALQFVNDGSTACTLVGVPTVALLRNGATTGTASRPSTDRARFQKYRLAPGAAAESKLKDFSSCNAPLSQTIKVTAPGSDISTTRPGQLRACQLVVYPLGAPE